MKKIIFDRKYCAAAVGISVIFIILLLIHGTGRQAEVRIEYCPSLYPEEESAIKELRIFERNNRTGILEKAEGRGFSYSEEDMRWTLDDGGDGSVTVPYDSAEMLSLCVEYRFKDGAALDQESIRVSRYENGIRKESRVYLLKDFTDRQQVCVFWTREMKLILFFSIILTVICAGGIIWRGFRFVSLKITDCAKTSDEGNENKAAWPERGFAWWYPLISSVFIITVAGLRASHAGIIYDEAYSYLEYVRYLKIEDLNNVITIFSDCMANNHLLNTVLGSLAVRCSRLSYDELVFRLPNILFGAAYAFMCCHMVWKRNISMAAYTLLTWNYYLNEYFSLARGYGMACSLALPALVYYRGYFESGFKEDTRLTASLLFLTVAACANTITLLLTAAMLISVFIPMCRKRMFFRYLKSQWMYYIPLGIANYYLFRYHLYVASNDSKLYTGNGAVFPPAEMLKCFVSSYHGGESWKLFFAVYAVVLIVSALLLLYGGRIYGERKRSTVFQQPLAVFFLLVLVCNWVIKQGFPYGRVLIPFYPLFVLAFCEACGNLQTVFFRFFPRGVLWKKYLLRAETVCFTFTLVFLFIRRIDFFTISEEPESAGKRQVAYDAMADRDTDYSLISQMGYPIIFYHHQIRDRYGFDIYTGALQR